MAAYSIQPMFVPHVLTGRKRNTIRAVGRRKHAVPGKPIQIYRGMRTKHCRLVLESLCRSVRGITIDWRDADFPSVYIDGIGRVTDLESFAHGDGFDSLAAMRKFWRENHPDAPLFRGYIIEWEPPPAPVEEGTRLPIVLMRKGGDIVRSILAGAAP